MPTYHPSPYQTQTPSFSSPLDQFASVSEGQIAGPSRGALVDRAFSLARSSSIKRNEEQQTPSGSGLRRTRHVDASHDGIGASHYPKAAQSHSDASLLQNNKERVQRLRAARLSQQQSEIHEASSYSSPSLDSAPLSSAFRDSLASNISFNSITGTEDRSSMMLLSSFNIEGNHTAKASGADIAAHDVDRIAREVRGLALRRRNSADTVRSSEFGEGGRWAKAWAGSEDGSDDDDEDEIDMDALRARDMVELDFGSASHVQQPHMGLGALGDLGNLQGAYAAMGLGQASSSTPGNSKDLPRLPHLHTASGAMHKVNLTPSHRVTSREKVDAVSQKPLSPGTRYAKDQNLESARPTRRNTMTSIAGEMGVLGKGDSSDEDETEGARDYNDTDSGDGERQYGTRAHVRNDSSASVSTITGSLTSNNNNEHVLVWPPTPAGSEHGATQSHAHDSHPNTLRPNPLPGIGVAQRALVEHAKGQHGPASTAHAAQSVENVSPSAFLAFDDGSPLPFHRVSYPRSNDRQRQSATTEQQPTGYSDPNRTYYPGGAVEILGAARRKAIADRDGRESMVSDLDVETLRLDGSSVAGGSQAGDWDPRRDSRMSVSSVDLDEQRKRRSRLEQVEGASAGYGLSTVRGFQTPAAQRRPDIQEQSSLPRQAYPRHPQTSPNTHTGVSLKRNVSHPSPVKEKSNPMGGHAPLQPRRSNTMPDEPNGVPTKGAGAALWSASSGNDSVRSPQMGSGVGAVSPSIRSINQSNGLSSPNMNRSAAVSGRRTSEPPAASQAEKFLTLGISHHESGDLSRSAYYFERSAKVDGGCVVGMCMWGMALREGWGVRKDQKRGFEWISRAASKAGEMMSGKVTGTGNGDAQRTRTEAELKAVRSELKLSVYELGKCFCYGWGVKMDKQMALEYFELAAKLGDADAQAEAGALLAAGKGCKKDLKKAAMYYRLAEAQGYDTVGLSWIHKDKYDPTPIK